MSSLFSWFSFLTEHKEIIVSFIVALIGLVKLTTWGRAQAAALDTIVRIIEGYGSKELKAAVARKEPLLAPAAQDALRDAVATADPKKPTPGIVGRVVREVFRFGK